MDTVGTACFTAFCVAATVYLLCMWVVYPQLWRTAPLVRHNQETFHRRRTFSSALGCGNVLFGRFHVCPSWLTVNALLPDGMPSLSISQQAWSSVQTQCRPVPPSSTLCEDRAVKKKIIKIYAESVCRTIQERKGPHQV